ncbi:indolepyruvate ferredoxin oxidoreductase subunit alpha [Desulfurella sp.]|uniref:indolepyruvate ferredoxin oxidoreductase subunit alpha n=1 Tax=Desulfurella sp. TaxID=1962857 RepID=UPI0025C6F5BD|nr:indolepyruvate ferredoxin oxidoreductase subunit alpha [Desulfurella sp.]
MRKIISGNEAIAIGAYRANASFASGYPGTPSSEILEYTKTFEDIKVQWASNEKSAFEQALGSSIAGRRSFVTMKHVGLNVAADSLMSSSYTGVNAGFVVVVADDPGMHSSQNEQDTRLFAKFAQVPILEPSDAKEAMGFMQYAFSLSEEYDTPVILRSTTRVSHTQELVYFDMHKLGGMEDKLLAKNISKYVLVPKNALLRHKKLLERNTKLQKLTNEIPLNKMEQGSLNVGIITSGVSYLYAKELLPEANFLKIGLSWPFPIDLAKEFAKNFEKVIVIEELEPYIEEQLKIADIKNVEGKKFFPQDGEFNLDIVEEGLAKASVLEKRHKKYFEVPKNLPLRPPVLCPGCPHRPIFDILHSLRVYVTGDIGCYTLGAAAPLSSIHTTVCMGASISMGYGIAKASQNHKIVSVIGDSTFLHTGIQPLIDAYVNNVAYTVIILDNSITAMTGGQPDAVSGFNIKNEPAPKVDLENLVRSIGIKRVFKVDQYDYKKTKEIIEQEVNTKELSVIIATRPCVLAPIKIKEMPYFVIVDKCIDCKRCLRIGCPAIGYKENKAYIIEDLCTGCGLCAEVCPTLAIVKGESNE